MLFGTGNQEYGSPTDAFNFLRSPVFLQDMLQTTVNLLLHNPSPKFLQEMLLAQTFSPVSFGQSLSPRNAWSSFHSLKSFLQFHLLKVFLQDIPGVRFARSNLFSNFTCPKPFSKIFLVARFARPNSFSETSFFSLLDLRSPVNSHYSLEVIPPLAMTRSGSHISR